MLRVKQLKKYRKHLEERYQKLVERANDYRYEDEGKSDLAFYKAMKIREKLSRITFLENVRL